MRIPTIGLGIAMLLLVAVAASGDNVSSGADNQTTADVSRVLAFVDANGDQTADASELKIAQQAAAALLTIDSQQADRDGNGAISSRELRAAYAEAQQALADADDSEDAAARAELTHALSVQTLIAQLAASQKYADELADLRAAVGNLDDDSAVMTYVVQNPARFPHLSPVFRTYVRYWPTHPALKRVVVPRHPPAVLHPGHVPGPQPKAAAPHPKKAPGPRAPHAPARARASRRP